MNKQIRKIPALLLLAACMSMPSSAQTAYKGQLYISGESFTRQGDLLRVCMKVSYDESAVGRGESLTFTPVIKSDSSACRLSSVVINGDRREKAEHRADVLGKRRRSNIPVVVRDSRPGERYFKYDTTVPYQEWMKHGRLYTESEECDCGNRKGNLFEDLILAPLPIFGIPDSGTEPTAVNSGLLGFIQFIRPAGFVTTLYSYTGTLPLSGDRRTEHPGTRRFNEAVGDAIRADIRNRLTRGGTSLVSVSVKGYGAPAGNYRRNEAAAMKQALSLKEYLMGSPLTGTGSIDVSWIAEDWDSISAIVRQGDMSLKDAVLNIIRAVDVADGREKELGALGHGEAYRHLCASVFPKVRRICYTITFRQQNTENTDIRTTQASEDNPSKMSPGNLYATAAGYKPGSREFNDITDLSARLFPDCAEAAINAAGVAVLRGDFKLAHQYLDSRMTDPRAYNNAGVLYMAEGNDDKAEVYLQMAEAAGVAQSAKALKYLHSKKK